MPAYWFGTFTPERILLDAGFVHVYWYSVLVVAGIVAAAAVAQRYYARSGGNEQDFVDIVFYAIIGGLIGARAWHVFVFHWDYYSQHLSDIVRIWEGGIAIQGALLGGAIAAYIVARKRRIDFVSIADALVIGIPLGQAIGRWGNFFNQELYGLPTTLPWGIFIEEEFRIAGYEAFTHFHPAFLYESVLNVILFIILLRIARVPSSPGTLVATYLLGYSIIRFIVDFVRIDPMTMVGPLRASQLVALGLVVVSLGLMYRTRLHHRVAVQK